MFLSLAPSCVPRFLALSFRTGRHLSVRAFPTSSMPILWMLSASLSARAGWGVRVPKRIQGRILWTILGICVAHSSACHPSSIRSRISSLYFSFCFARGGYHVALLCTTSHGHVLCFQRFWSSSSIVSAGIGTLSPLFRPLSEWSQSFP